MSLKCSFTKVTILFSTKVSVSVSPVRSTASLVPQELVSTCGRFERGKAQSAAFRRAGLDGWLGIPVNLHVLSASSLNLCCLADEANIFLLPEETSCSLESNCNCKDQSLLSNPSTSRPTCSTGSTHSDWILKVCLCRELLSQIFLDRQSLGSQNHCIRGGLFGSWKANMFNVFIFFRRKLSTWGMICFVLNEGREKCH